MKTKIKKYIRNYIPVICTLLFIPIFSVNTFAADVSPDAKNEWFLLPFNELFDFKGTFDDTLGTFYATGSGSSRYLQFEVGDDHSSVLPLLQNGHTYLIYGTLSLASSNPSGWASSISLYEFINDSTQSYIWSNNYLDNHVDYNRDTYSVSGIYSFTLSEDIFLNTGGALVWEQTETIDFSGRCSWAFYALDVTNNTQEQINSIITAINNQTSQLGSQLGEIDSGIDKGNDLIENGNEDTQSAVSDFNEVFEDFNAELSKVDEFEADIVDEFNTANEAYLTELNNFSLTGSLMNASSWLSTSMQRVYNHSSDYKMLWLVPLLFGIPVLLFVIKRGKDDEQ